MNRKIRFGDDSTLEIVVSVVESGKMATIAYNSLLDFIDEELLDRPDIALQTDEDLTEAEDDELALDDLDDEEFEDDDLIDFDSDDEFDEDELEEDRWGDDDLDDKF